MPEFYSDSTITLYHGDCLAVLAELPDASVDSVCTDPPYGLANTDPAHVAETITRWVNGERDYLPGGSGFMGKAWDAFVPPVAVWDECLRVLKPGGHVLAFAGSRTVDLMTLGLRLAGFDIRDSVAWLYGSGFPKSLDVSKAIDKAAGATREVVGTRRKLGLGGSDTFAQDAWTQAQRGMIDLDITAPSTDDARTWQGWGTALKPAFEPVVVARKPLAGTVAANVLTHGTGALNIDGCRVAHASAADLAESAGKNRHADFGSGPRENKVYGTDNRARGENGNYDGSKGRWPANVVLDESQAAALDEQSGELASQKSRTEPTKGTDETDSHIGAMNGTRGGEYLGQAGGASRFFYVAKADASERVRIDGIAHPTVKPLALMRWLVRLVTPPGGIVLEPFAGSGTTVEACILEGFRCVAIEREADYLPLIVQRIHRRRDPVQAVKGAGIDGGLFDMLDGGAA